MKVKTLLTYLGLAVTAVLTLIPFFSVGFTTADDFQYYNTAQTSWQIWMADAKIYAESTGRFYFLVTKVFYYVPYLIDSFGYTKAVQYISLLACYAMFAWLVYKLFRSRNLSLLTFMLLVFDTVITPNNHIPTIAYPFYFSFSIIIFIAALLFYLYYLERGGYWRVIVSAVLFLAAYLFYETYLIFAILFGILVLARHWREKGFASLWRSPAMWRETLPYAVTALIYIGCYWGYRQWLLASAADRTFYDGASFSMETFSIGGFFNVLWRCTRGAFPGESYFVYRWLLIENSQLIAGHRSNLWRVLTHAPAIVWVNALLQAVLLWVLTRPQGFKNLRGGRVGAGIAIGIAVAFLAHTLIGMATKYNLEWSNWMQGYVTTIYSILALMLVLALLMAGSVMLCRRRWAHRTVRLAWCLLLVLFSVVMGYANHHISRAWARSQHSIDLIDLIGKSGYFNTLPDDAVLYTEELHNTSWAAYEISKMANDLEHYIDLRAGRRFNYVTDTADLAQALTGKPLYYVHAIETKKACETLIAFARIDSTGNGDPNGLTASGAEVFYYSPCKEYTVFYQSAGEWKYRSYAAENPTMRLTQVSLSDSAINPRSIVISDMTMP